MLMRYSSGITAYVHAQLTSNNYLITGHAHALLKSNKCSCSCETNN